MDKFEEVYSSIEGMEFNKEIMIQQFETLYGKSTRQFRNDYEQNNFEGNADEQIWYLISR
ncbi:hypothetical protein M3664_04630 [Paenibacillus lautus]|uniref:hypothetical protein n=1 Tax=Paenibacillus lautus TaxID=1401 RepID=UPI00203E1C9E|nr:hypothetical protein [Paenibacillus lautus]MCM3257067.1 hypothetical protein [Paenibacillus lautus]